VGYNAVTDNRIYFYSCSLSPKIRTYSSSRSIAL